MPLCECGCGREVKPGNRFINYHQNRGENNPAKLPGVGEKISKSKLGISRSPEHCDAISRAKLGIPNSPEHNAALSAASRNSEAAKNAAERRCGIPRTLEHIAAIKNGMEESGAIDKMRGGHDIVNHHYIYDHSDLSKYTMKMTRSRHQRLHRLMQISGTIVPHINMEE